MVVGIFFFLGEWEWIFINPFFFLEKMLKLTKDVTMNVIGGT